MTGPATVKLLIPNVVLALGVAAWNARVQCPSPAPPGDCLSEQDFTTTTTTTPTTTPLYDYYYELDDSAVYLPPFTDSWESWPLQKTTPGARRRSAASSVTHQTSFCLSVYSTVFVCLVFLLYSRSRQ